MQIRPWALLEIVEFLKALPDEISATQCQPTVYRKLENNRPFQLVLESILPLLPPAPMPRRAAGGARGGAEFGTGLARVGGLEDTACGVGADVVGRFARRRAIRAVGQGFRAVHF